MLVKDVFRSSGPAIRVANQQLLILIARIITEPGEATARQREEYYGNQATTP
jgi:hypothetical protein